MTRMCITKKEDQRFYIRTIRGDCLEKAGVFIPFGGYVIIDGRAKVNIGDLVICGWCLGDLDKYIKQVKKINGDSVIVGTAYLDSTRDFSFEAATIFGVVTEVYRKDTGYRVYARH